jgi:hypothetical protein
MPRCYLLALCAGSSVDRDQNNFTLYSLIERVTLPRLMLPTEATPFEAHVYLESEEIGREVELQVYWRDEQGHERRVIEQTPAILLTPPRTRLRLQNVFLPLEAGHHEMRVKWRYREDGATWEDGALYWPLDLVVGQTSVPFQVTH